MGAEGAKPPPHTPVIPTNAAGKGNGAAAGAGLVGLWNKLTGHGTSAVSNVHQHVAQVAYTVRREAKNVKWSMPVDVKIDFLRPAFETVKDTLTTTWIQLPPPVQQAAPFVGVAVGSGLIVYLVQQRRVNYHRTNSENLTGQVKLLKKEKEELLKRINLLKARSGSPRSEVEARMASAVAEATNAAAAAADAAARAATACIYQRPPLPLPPVPN